MTTASSLELYYEGMEIADGRAAMQAYHEMNGMEPWEGVERLRRTISVYCELDTLAMVRILEELVAIAPDGYRADRE